MVAEKETLSVTKCPDKMPKRTKLRAHQPHSLVSEGFTVKAMMKNSVVSDPPEPNAPTPVPPTPGHSGGPASPWILSPGPGWSLPRRAIAVPVADGTQQCGGLG